MGIGKYGYRAQVLTKCLIRVKQELVGLRALYLCFRDIKSRLVGVASWQP